MSNIRIDIASEFKDKGFKQAEKASAGLDRQLKTLAKTLGATLSVQQIYQFGKASVKAFSDDQKAAFRLTQTLNNLGLAFEDARVTKFISDLEAASGVLDDELRPAMQSLLMTTGSVTKSQELLGLALDISRGTGVDLASVASDLSKAYVGQTRSLAKYNLGLARTELQTKSFSDLQDILNKKFSGQSAAYLETYAGKVGVLNVAFANMQETVGKGLVDAFEILAGEGGIGAGTRSMQIFGDEVANVTRGMAELLAGFKSFKDYGGTVLQFFKSFVKEGSIVGAIRDLGKQNKPLFFPTAGDPLANERARKRAEAAALKRQKELLALQQKAAKAAKKAEDERLKKAKEAMMLQRAGSIFDMENIQIVAALQNKVTEENRLRLITLLAIQNENAEAADKLSQAVLKLQSPMLANLGITVKTGDNATDVINKIITAQTKLFLLNTGIANLPKAKNPFEDWDSILDRLLAKINSIKSAINGFGSGGGNSGGAQGGGSAGGGNGGGGGGSGSTVNANPADPTGVNILMPNGQIGNPFETFNVGGANIIANSGVITSGQIGDSAAATAERQRIADIFATIGTFGAGGFNPTNVTVNVAGNVMSNDDLLQVITEGLYEVQKRGQSITLSAVGL